MVSDDPTDSGDLITRVAAHPSSWLQFAFGSRRGERKEFPVFRDDRSASSRVCFCTGLLRSGQVSGSSGGIWSLRTPYLWICGHTTRDETHGVPLFPIAGAVALIGGVAS
jgi:hypothetical protein